MKKLEALTEECKKLYESGKKEEGDKFYKERVFPSINEIVCNKAKESGFIKN